MLEAHESFATGHLLAEPFPGNRTNPIGELETVGEMADAGPGTEALSSSSEWCSRVRAALAGLPKEQREAIEIA